MKHCACACDALRPAYLECLHLNPARLQTSGMSVSCRFSARCRYSCVTCVTLCLRTAYHSIFRCQVQTFDCSCKASFFHLVEIQRHDRRITVPIPNIPKPTEVRRSHGYGYIKRILWSHRCHYFARIHINRICNACPAVTHKTGDCTEFWTRGLHDRFLICTSCYICISQLCDLTHSPVL